MHMYWIFDFVPASKQDVMVLHGSGEHICKYFGISECRLATCGVFGVGYVARPPLSNERSNILALVENQPVLPEVCRG